MVAVCRKYLPDVLHYELSSVYFLSCEQAPSFPRRRFGVYARILMFLELSVLTQIPTITCLIITFCRHHSIETSLPAIVGYVTVLEVSLLVGFRLAIAGLDLIALGDFPFPL